MCACHWPVQIALVNHISPGTIRVPSRLFICLATAIASVAVPDLPAQVPSLAPEDATPTTNTDVSSFITTGYGYDAWTGSARRVVHDIFPVAGSLARGALKLDRTYNSHNNALEQGQNPRSPGQVNTAARFSYSWSMRGLDYTNDPIDPGV